MVYKVQCRAAGVFWPRCPDDKEHKWQLIHPVLSLEPNLEGAFQLAVERVERLNNDVGLWVVGRCVGRRDSIKVLEFCPIMAGELRTTIGGDVLKHSKTGNPVMNEDAGTGVWGSVWKWDGFRPPGEAADDCEEVIHALRLVKKTH